MAPASNSPCLNPVFQARKTAGMTTAPMESPTWIAGGERLCLLAQCQKDGPYGSLFHLLNLSSKFVSTNTLIITRSRSARSTRKTVGEPQAGRRDPPPLEIAILFIPGMARKLDRF
jgi:hypothetical protein